MAAHPQPRLTPEQYLELERASDVGHEYYRGETFAMADRRCRTRLPGTIWPVN